MMINENTKETRSQATYVENWEYSTLVSCGGGVR